MAVHRVLLTLLVSCALAACSTSGPPADSTGRAVVPREGMAYYAQSVNGHLALMRAARPLEDWLADPATPPALNERLAQVQRMRRFAVDELHLPDNASYTRYADLKRRAVVWNVVATPEFSLQLKTWCFVVVGCVGYRGYFDEAEAHALAERLRTQGLDAVAYPVPAYSTLGWTNWLGGDPVLSTFIGYPEGEVARLLFHELAHQVLYVADDTTFNESFATAVERLGGERWLAQASPAARADYAAFDERRRAFRALTLSVRKNLEQIYDSALDGKEIAAIENKNALRASKHAVMADFRQRYAELKAGWGGHSGYDAWVARANNASFAVQAAYDAQVPAFMALFEREGRDWPRFYDAVREWAALPKAERDTELARLVQPSAQQP